MSTRTLKVPADVLSNFVTGIFQGAGCSEQGARDMAECLVQTNLWGIDSHGVLRTPEYLKRFQSGAMNNQPEVRTLKTGGALEVLDAICVPLGEEGNVNNLIADREGATPVCTWDVTDSDDMVTTRVVIDASDGLPVEVQSFSVD